ncbi:hypothetical protein Pla52o_24040 [Novipirellula galeiformis]|uniref:Uncharacterized protein n=1 Tax=Novipirellula galeiformis TaxID=2528004 RepID=A0A5C6CFF8_9BACT|nr:hypothetical protein [Novipirellula galeiformis]TWU22872.1 hypothetical protein Pla52o_24040 [Novipirellula galeiformis]
MAKPDSDVFDTDVWSDITASSEPSVANDSSPVDFPDFKLKNRRIDQD